MEMYPYLCSVINRWSNQPRKPVTMKNAYGIFLMIELARCLNLIDKELEYDLTWEQGEALHDEFVGSEFDDSYKGEYECITNFLKSKGGANPKVITTCSNCGSRDVEIRSWIHQRTGTIGGETGDDGDTWCNDCEGHHGVEVEILE